MRQHANKRQVRLRRTVLFGSFICVLLLAVLQINPARADVLTDLRATLKGLNGPSAVEGVLNVQSTVVSGKSDSTKPSSAKLQLDIQAGDGLSVHLSPGLMQQITAEQATHAADPDAPTPITDLLNNIGPIQIGHLVSTAPALLQKLVGVTAPVIKPTVLEGEPVQELSLNLPLRPSKNDDFSVKDYRDNLLLWLNQKGIPQAYQEIIHAKFCKFFLCLTLDEQHDGWLQVVDGRLVTVKLTQEHKQSGLGQDSDTHTVYNLQLQQITGKVQSKSAQAHQ